MSRATLRAGIQAWLSSQVVGINTVYSAQPQLIPASAFYAPGTFGASSGCVAVIDILSETENRIALGGATSGWKRVDYQVGVQLFFRSTAPAPLNQDAGQVAMAAFDTIIENLKLRIRADRTAGGTVWQWGEGSLIGTYGEMVAEGDARVAWAMIQTEVTEMTQT